MWMGAKLQAHKLRARGVRSEGGDRQDMADSMGKNRKPSLQNRGERVRSQPRWQVIFGIQDDYCLTG